MQGAGWICCGAEGNDEGLGTLGAGGGDGKGCGGALGGGIEGAGGFEQD